MTRTYEKQEEIKQHAIEYLKKNKDYLTCYACDLHLEIFNTDYYIIGRYQAKEWLKEFAFDAIETIKQYEQDNFGEVTTDFSEPEKIVNMYVYIVGESILNKSETLSEVWSRKLTKNDIEKIIKELRG